MANYKISDIEGIGPKYAEKLKAVGVRSVNALLEKGSTKKGRKDLADKSGIDETLILKWVNMADLYRISIWIWGLDIYLLDIIQSIVSCCSGSKRVRWVQDVRIVNCIGIIRPADDA